jgi:hypothetical protein
MKGKDLEGKKYGPIGVLSPNWFVGIEEKDEKFQSQYLVYFTVVLCPKSCV